MLDTLRHHTIGPKCTWSELLGSEVPYLSIHTFRPTPVVPVLSKPAENLPVYKSFSGKSVNK